MKEESIEKVNNDYEEVNVPQKKIRTDSYFDGSFIEYIGYKLLALIITVFTLTIASAWAEKILISYRINHTIYNGKRLKFEGTGASLFVERFKWIFFSIITLGIYSWWIPIKKERWIVSNIHFEDEDYINNDSYFDGKVIGMIGVNLFTYLLSIMSFGLLVPFAVCYKYKWIAKHTIINKKRLVFNGKAVSLIGHYLLWYLLSIITIGIYSIWVPMKVYGWYIKKTHIKTQDEQEIPISNVPKIVGPIILVIFVVLIVFGIKESGFSFKGVIDWISGSGKISEIFEGKTSVSRVVENGPVEVEPLEIDDGQTGKTETTTSSVQSGSSSSQTTTTKGTVEKPAAPVERCNNGYVYYEEMCYNPSDYMEPSHSCPNGDLHLSGSCYTIMDDSYCENATEDFDYIYLEGKCVNNQMSYQESSSCQNGYKITVPNDSYGFESMLCYKYANPNY